MKSPPKRGSIVRCFKCYWHLFKGKIRTTFQLMRGLWLLSKLPPKIVSIFGGTNFSANNHYAQKAYELACMLADNNIAILTGGGPGIMQAANCGARIGEGKGRLSMGVGVKGLEQMGEIHNTCVQLYVQVSDLETRKWLLTQYSQAFAFFPGGFGTLDELATILTLIKTKEMQGVPIVLIGTAYWKPLMTWITESALKNGLVTSADVGMLAVTDDLYDAFCLLYQQCIPGQKPPLKDHHFPPSA
jgi:uncharacterized protein (TIGR00730 family)